MVKKISLSPAINHHEAVFSGDLCARIIKAAEPLLKPSKVVAPDGGDAFNTSYRDASTCSLKRDHNADVEYVYREIEKLTGISTGRFENFTVTHYLPGQFYRQHQDYFHHLDGNPGSLVERCKTGGNRVDTVIIYLNKPGAGGETYFPWLDATVEPGVGSVLHFSYNYSDPFINVKTTHAGLPPITGEKWIVTLWAREHTLDTDCQEFKRFMSEAELQRQVCSTDYGYNGLPGGKKVCIPLEGNTDPTNSLIVGYDGRKGSKTLLYILGALNNLQVIPWLIQPVYIGTRAQFDREPHTGELTKIKQGANLIKTLVGGNISTLDFVCVEAKDSLDRNSILYGCYKYFDDGPKKRFRSFKKIYMGDTALIEPGTTNKLDTQIYSSMVGLWVTPFHNLNSMDIDILVKELNLDFIK